MISKRVYSENWYWIERECTGVVGKRKELICPRQHLRLKAITTSHCKILGVAILATATSSVQAHGLQDSQQFKLTAYIVPLCQ